MNSDQPAVSRPTVVRFGAVAANNTGDRGAVHSLPPDPADDAATVPVRAEHGRRARRLQRRQERSLQPEIIEMWAIHESGHEMRHRSSLEAVRRIARELRDEGYQIRWLPVEARNYPMWNWQVT